MSIGTPRECFALDIKGDKGNVMKERYSVTKGDRRDVYNISRSEVEESGEATGPTSAESEVSGTEAAAGALLRERVIQKLQGGGEQRLTVVQGLGVAEPG
jgi:hypothetical protein